MLRRSKFTGIAIASIVCVSSLAGVFDDPVQVRIGVLAKRGAEICLAKWGPTAEYLSNEIPNFSFTIVPLGYDQVNPSVEQHKVDFILANSGFYVGLERFYSASRIATLKNQYLGKTYTTYGGVVFCRADRDDIKNYADLKGKTFMSLDENAFASWHTISFELQENGVDPYRDFSELSFKSPMDAVVLAVRDGKVDAGSVRTDMLERMALEGTIKLEDFRVLHQHSGDVHLGLLHSTRPYPEWPFAKVSHTTNSLAEQVAVALLKMSPDDPAAQAARSAGWTIPHNYQSVHECLKALSVSPYEDTGKLTLSQAFKQFWPWLLVPLAIIVLVSTTRQMQINRRLLHAITVRKRVEEALRRSEERLQLSIQKMPVAFIVWDLEWQVIEWNTEAENIFGYSKAEILGKSVLDHIVPLAARPMVADLIQGYKEGRSVDFSEPNNNMRKDGKLISCKWRNTPLADERGDVFAVLAMAEDVTERIAADEELSKYRGHLEELVEERTAQLEVANKELESFAYSVSHDLRAPLRAIDGFSQLLLEDHRETLNKDGKGYLDRVRAGTQRMGRLIDDLLQLSRFSQVEILYKTVNLSAIANETAKELKKDDPKRKIEFSIAQDLTSRGDANLLGVVLTNLLHNAWKFTATRANARIEFGVERENGENVYFIRDNGAGFNMAYVDKLFGAFQRLHTESEFPGEGIGLATVQRIIHRHGGRVWAKGIVDEGAIFYFTLQSGSNLE